MLIESNTMVNISFVNVVTPADVIGLSCRFLFGRSPECGFQRFFFRTRSLDSLKIIIIGRVMSDLYY